MPTLPPFLSSIADVIALCTFGFSLYSALMLAGQERRRRREFVGRAQRAAVRFEELVAANEGIQSPKPRALAISTLQTVANDSIERDVRRFLSAANMPMDIYTVTLDGIEGREGVIEFNRRLDVARQTLDAEGVTEVHVFFAGPVAAAMLVGAKLRNWRYVKVYQHAGASYVYWYPIT